jgi:hypothetical protein
MPGRVVPGVVAPGRVVTGVVAPGGLVARALSSLRSFVARAALSAPTGWWRPLAGGGGMLIPGTVCWRPLVRAGGPLSGVTARYVPLGDDAADAVPTRPTARGSPPAAADGAASPVTGR